MTFFEEGYFSLFGDDLPLNFVVPKGSNQIMHYLLLNIACVTAIDHHRVAVLIGKVVEIV